MLGDVMLDEFVWGRVSRISPEAPVPVVQVTGQSFHLGGAGNVAANVRALGAGAVLAGVVGRDAAGERVREALPAAGVEPRLVELGRDRPTTVKTRIVAHGQQVVRADREDTADVPSGADVAGPLHGRAPSYPVWDVVRPEVLETAAYFDPANFAPRIRARALVSMGFIDETSTPTSIWSVFNGIRGDKEVVPLVDSPHNHLATPAQREPFARRSAEWLRELAAAPPVVSKPH